MDLTYQPMKEEQTPAVARILSHAFAGTPESSTEWLKNAGIRHARVLAGAGARDEVAACLLRIPMGQYFGGRSVPLVGIAGVAVAPEARGRGVAGRMMAQAVREIAAEGVALSGLYPATQPLYRRVGYEQAGHRFEVRLPVGIIDTRERDLAVRPIEGGDEASVRACYRRFAEGFEGPLDRGEYLWRRVREGRDTAYHGFAAWSEAGEIEGYLYLSQTRKPERGRQDIALSDLAFTTPRGGRRLLAFLREFSSLGDQIVLYAGPLHPVLSLLAEQRYAMHLREHWMLRVTDAARALEARGYRGGSGEVHLEVRDELLPRNAGRWLLAVEAGRGSVSRGGRGDLRLDVRALAPLYSGLLSARQLRLLGWAEGDDGAVAAADRVFAGTTPWLGDMY
jgi:predicted acetyltransferase